MTATLVNMADKYTVLRYKRKMAGIYIHDQYTVLNKYEMTGIYTVSAPFYVTNMKWLVNTR